MKLVPNEIPVEFLQALPSGMKLVKRHGHSFLVVEEVTSPSGQSLMSEAVRIHHEPSIRIGMRVGSQRGLVFVDAYWGSHAKLFSFIPDQADQNQIVDAYDPETTESLMVDYTCAVDGCGCTRGIELLLPDGGGTIRVCARLGCPGHRLEVPTVAQPVVDSISGINFFGAGTVEDDWFDV